MGEWVGFYFESPSNRCRSRRRVVMSGGARRNADEGMAEAPRISTSLQRTRPVKDVIGRTSTGTLRVTSTITPQTGSSLAGPKPAGSPGAWSRFFHSCPPKNELLAPDRLRRATIQRITPLPGSHDLGEHQKPPGAVRAHSSFFNSLPVRAQDRNALQASPSS